MRRVRAAALIGVLGILVLALTFPVSDARAQPSPTEYQVKAAALFHFARFVHWPASALNGEALVIGILGHDPFGKILDDTVRGKTIGNKPFTVRRLAGPSEAASCHILFISSSEDAALETILAAVEGKAVLTVGEATRFAERGGMVDFQIENNKVRFAINADSV